MFSMHFRIICALELTHFAKWCSFIKEVFLTTWLSRLVLDQILVWATKNTEFIYILEIFWRENCYNKFNGFSYILNHLTHLLEAGWFTNSFGSHKLMSALNCCQSLITKTNISKNFYWVALFTKCIFTNLALWAELV